MTSLHAVRNEELVKSDYQVSTSDNTIWSGVNALFSTASDYMKFCQMLLNGGEWNGKRLLSPKTIELMTQNHVGELYDRPGHGFGLGFAVANDLADSNLPGSEGVYFWVGAYCTYFFIDPEEDMIAILMTQNADFTWYYHDKMRQLIYQAVVE